MRHIYVSKTLARWALIAALAISLPGCAAVALTAGGIAGGAGVNHSLSGVAYKTFNAPMDELRVATLDTLYQMDMAVTEDDSTAEGWEIMATASDRKIDIELEKLTGKATRMRVVAHDGPIFFKDSATATEIIIQTADNLNG